MTPTCALLVLTSFRPQLNGTGPARQHAACIMQAAHAPQVAGQPKTSQASLHHLSLAACFTSLLPPPSRSVSWLQATFGQTCRQGRVVAHV